MPVSVSEPQPEKLRILKDLSPVDTAAILLSGDTAMKPLPIQLATPEAAEIRIFFMGSIFPTGGQS